MTTNRTPISRIAVSKITPECVALYREMRSSRSDAARKLANSRLRAALGLCPWQWPTTVSPDEDCCYPAGTEGAKWWPSAQALFVELEAAAGALN